MMERQISVICVAVWLLWGGSLALWGLALVMSNEDIGRLSLITCGAAVTVTTRMFFENQTAKIKTALQVTAPVRSMRT